MGDKKGHKVIESGKFAFRKEMGRIASLKQCNSEAELPWGQAWTEQARAVNLVLGQERAVSIRLGSSLE